MIADALAVIQYFQKLNSEHAAGRDRAEAERLLVSQMSQALSHEIREALNLVELAINAHDKRDGVLRDHIVRSIELPLLESFASGLFGEGMNPELARMMLRDIQLESEDNAEMLGEAEDAAGAGAPRSLLGSRVVARVESMKVLASYPREITWVRWNTRLGKVKGELIGMLRHLLVAEEKSFAHSA